MSLKHQANEDLAEFYALAKAKAAEAGAITCSRRQLVEQRLGLFQIERVEAFGEPALDRGEQIASLIPLALIAPRAFARFERIRRVAATCMLRHRGR